ncbi:hypothetical protein FA13DRAFT_711469 [Coprinellus micaceus]|uniref:F-box domain-containing protein n=1 Tax=Coprinellus micaceus TaxID=71717 RepID=A0A4Y7TUQ9_COPMI|nr:hypothetical protein FA13DRAFT_711469 [Coprinellus micaceus]
MGETQSRPKAEPLNEVVPNDVWLEIADLSEPPALLALGMTSKRLRELLHTTSVWSSVLRTVYRQRNISEASYPVHLMSVVEMQRAATAPYRVEKILVASAKRTGVETAHHINKLNSSAVYPIASLGAVDLSLTHLVPGGRLFVVAERDAVSVWDIGLAGSPLLASPQRMTRCTVCAG